VEAWTTRMSRSWTSTDAVVVIELAVGATGSPGQGVVDGGRGGAVEQRAVRALLVVDAGEEIEEGLELVESGGLAGAERVASSALLAGSAQLCRRWWGGWVGSSSGER